MVFPLSTLSSPFVGGVVWGAGDSGVNFVFRLPPRWAPLRQAAPLQEKEPFVGTNASGTQLQLLLISSCLSGPFGDEAFEVHAFSGLVIVRAPLGKRSQPTGVLGCFPGPRKSKGRHRRGQPVWARVGEVCVLLQVATKE